MTRTNKKSMSRSRTISTRSLVTLLLLLTWLITYTPH